MYQRARKGISYLPQEASVFRKLSVEDNLMAILQTLRLNRRERRDRMDQLIEQLGLEQVRKSKGYVLSGGERRRVEIARSLVIDPSFLLLDEPFSGIDPIQVLELQKIIFDLKNAGIGILITDHNVRETLAVTDRAYIINDGRIFRSGSPESLGQRSRGTPSVSGGKLQHGPGTWAAGPAGLSSRGASGLLTHDVGEMGHHHGHFLQRLTGGSRREMAGGAEPGVGDAIVDGEHLPLNRRTLRRGLTRLFQHPRKDCVIAVQGVAEATQIRGVLAKLRLDLQKSQLIGGGDVAREIATRLRAQNQQAGITEPVAEPEHGTRGDDHGNQRAD